MVNLHNLITMAGIVLDEKKKREIDPTLTVLRVCVLNSANKSDEKEYANKKLKELAGTIK
ncbi:MAG: hypothetical protein E2O67_04950 [Deltaproteobacteria bacterium]|nr:MAG: hypothetical protein E2O67_04950 [Deltaproteobacteria bacterium]